MMNTCEKLAHEIAKASADVEVARLSAGLIATIAFVVDADAFRVRIENGIASVEHLDVGASASGRAEGEQSGWIPDVSITATAGAWAQVLSSPPPPTYHSFTALELANPDFEVAGKPQLIAQCRPVLERLIECIVHAPTLPTAPVARDVTAVSGRYVSTRINGELHHVYVEQAGTGTPVLMLHTAGADSRQFMQQLSDSDLGKRFAMYAVDMPYHGRTMPPTSWRGGPYKLTADTYLSWCEAILRTVIGVPAVIVGGSMGAAMSLLLAAERPELVLGVVAIEPPYRSKGRRNPFQHHVGVHGGLHNASFVRGLMSPYSAESDRRLSSWIYSQGAPGIYGGDLAFYSEEFDGAVIGPKIDTNKTPVTLLCGTYDYSATPEDGSRLLAVIPGAKWVVMEGMGHFPMCENPDLFRPYLADALAPFA